MKAILGILLALYLFSATTNASTVTGNCNLYVPTQSPIFSWTQSWWVDQNFTQELEKKGYKLMIQEERGPVSQESEVSFPVTKEIAQVVKSEDAFIGDFTGYSDGRLILDYSWGKKTTCQTTFTISKMVSAELLKTKKVAEASGSAHLNLFARALDYYDYPNYISDMGHVCGESMLKALQQLPNCRQ